MTAEVSIDMNQLKELVYEVQKTQRSQTLQVADGVVAVFIPAKEATVSHTSKRMKKADAGRQAPAKRYTLESAFGSVPTPSHLRGKDVEEIIRDARDDYAERLMRQS